MKIKTALSDLITYPKQLISYVSAPKENSGFTIIEIMIVLAIGGLMLLLVFEAIPALERNGRNNQRKQDVATILEAVSHYQLNNSGTFPAKCGAVSQPLCNASSTQPLYYAKLTYYTDSVIGKVVVIPQSRTTAPVAIDLPALTNADPNAKDEVFIYNYERCDRNTQGAAVIAGAGYSDIVALYALETVNGVSAQCEQL